MNPAVVPLLVSLLNRFFPGGADKAKEPSTVLGLAELTAVLTAGLAHFGVAPEWAEPVGLVLLGVFALVNVWRRERGVGHD